LRLSENRVLWVIFRYKREKMAGGWRTLHNGEFYDLYASTNVIRVNTSRRVRLAGHAARMEKMGNTYKILVGKAEGN
jgi:hypothetical protein